MGNERETIQKFIRSDSFTKGFADILQHYKLHDKREVLSELIEKIVNGEMRFSRLGLELDKSIGEDADRNIAIVLAFEDLLLDIKDDIRTLQDSRSKAELTLESAQKILDSYILDLIRESKIKISDAVLKKRFQNLVFSWLRDVRDDFETKETAMRETRVGGLGLSPANAETFIALLKNTEATYKKQGVELSRLVNKYFEGKEEMFRKEHVEDIDIDVPVPVPAPPAEQVTYRAQTGETTIDQLLSEEKRRMVQEVVRGIAEKEIRIKAHAELPPPHPVAEGSFNAKLFQSRPRPDRGIETVSDQKRDVRAVSDEILQKATPRVAAPAPSKPKYPAQRQIQKPGFLSMFKKKAVVPANAGNELPKNIKQSRPLKQTALTATGRPKMQDIKFTPKLFGPIDELASMTVADFRRLANTPDDAVAKITAKLDLLQEESLHKRSEGVKALQSSDLYKAYTDILKQSVLEGKAYEDVVSKKNGITLSELRAIMKLQKRLKQ